MARAGRRLGFSQQAFAERIGVLLPTVGVWEARLRGIGPRSRERIVPLLAPHLATPEGEAFVASPGRDEE